MHLSEYDIACLIDGTLAARKQKAFVAHLADCPACTESVAGAVRSKNDIPRHAGSPVDLATLAKAMRLGRPAEQTRERPKRFLFHVLSRYAVAATIVLTIGLVSYIELRKPQSSQFRAKTRTLTVDVASPVDGARIAVLRPEFRWSEIPGAVLYRLYLFNDDGTIMWKWESPTSRFIPPFELSLQSNTRYLWRVEAQFPDGLRLSSELHVFTFAP